MGEELGRYGRAFSDRVWDFERRQRSVDFLEGSQCSLAALKSFVGEKMVGARQICCQVKKVLDKPDKPLPEGESTPAAAASLREWTTHVETIASVQKDLKWLQLNDKIG